MKADKFEAMCFFAREWSFLNEAFGGGEPQEEFKVTCDSYDDLPDLVKEGIKRTSALVKACDDKVATVDIPYLTSVESRVISFWDRWDKKEPLFTPDQVRKLIISSKKKSYHTLWLFIDDMCEKTPFLHSLVNTGLAEWARQIQKLPPYYVIPKKGDKS